MARNKIGTRDARRKMRDACVYGGYQEDDKLYFRDDAIYIQSDADGYLNIVADTGIKLGGSALTATGDEITRPVDTSGRFVATTSTALSVTAALHAERIILINSNSAGASTMTLPEATGTGNKYTFIQNIDQTQGSIVVAALTTDTMMGQCINVSNTEEATQAFVTSATSDKITLNGSTSGGSNIGDVIECIDAADTTWSVFVKALGNGTLITPFSETSA